jgi:integrase
MGYVEDLKGKKQAQGRPRWRARWRDPAGRERSKSFARKIDAERFLTSVEDAKLRGAYVDPSAGKAPFGPWAERWYASTAALQPTTRRDYSKLLDQQVLPYFASTPLAAIDPLMLREWIAGLVADGLSAKRARKAFQVVSQILGRAVEGGRLARNVAERIRLPKEQRREVHFLTAVQVEAVAELIRPPFGTVVRFAAYTGLRPSELTALRVSQLDLLRGTVRVVEGAPEVDGHLLWGGTTKTFEGRTVRLPRFLREELARYLADRPHRPEDLVFTAILGGPLRPSKFVRNYFKPAIRAAGLPESVRLYDLRHTCASLLIAEGGSVKAVQAQLGHKTATMTLDTYGHLFPDETIRLAERLDRARTEALADRLRTSSQRDTDRGRESAAQ